MRSRRAASFLVVAISLLTGCGASESKTAERMSCGQIAPVLREVDRIYHRTIIVGGNSAQQQSRQFPPIMRATDRAFKHLASIKVAGNTLPPRVRDLRNALSHRMLWGSLAAAWDCASGRSCGRYDDEDPLHELGTDLRWTQGKARALSKTCSAMLRP
jgi:hypothetical protein